MSWGRIVVVVAVAITGCARYAASPARHVAVVRPVSAPDDARREALDPVVIDAGAPPRGGAETAWRVTLTDRARAVPRDETWATFEHGWKTGAPESIRAERTMCLPKGRYVVELATAPSFTSVVTLGGAAVIRQDHFPTEISSPFDADGSCAEVRVAIDNPLHFTQMHVSLIVRESAAVADCDRTSFPRGAWNACLFRGRHREEPIGRETWTTLEVPKKQPPGRNDSFDWYAIEARSTVCFDKGDYIFHTTSDDTLTLDVGGRTVLETPPTRRFPVADSPKTALAGCVPVTVTHAYRYGHSVLEVVWAKVGSAAERRWARERACDFTCDDASVCTNGDKLPNPRPGRHVCVPTTRLGREMEYCDDAHPCAPGQGVCVRTHGCYQR